jgi:hypothetical protein
LIIIAGATMNIFGGREIIAGAKIFMADINIYGGA